MIDHIVVFQACAAGLIVRRAMHEPNKWDRAGFVLLACSVALMTIRRVTIALDRIVMPESGVLPYAIVWAMMAAATCFTVEVFHRIAVTGSVRTGARMTKYLWPFGTMVLMAASDFVPVQRWNGEPVKLLTQSEAITNVIRGKDTSASCDVILDNCSRGIDALRILAYGTGTEAEHAREALSTLAERFSPNK